MFLAVLLGSLFFFSQIFLSGSKGNAGEGDNFPEKGALNQKTTPNCSDCVPRLIDGEPVKPGKENLPPVAVIIDNHSKARPPHGLSRASLVYETEAEGKITRFLAIFDTGSDLDKIGPVRSARPYFIDWARELSAPLVHCGGSPAALATLIKSDLLNLNEFYQTNYFWRENGAQAPHNIYTSASKINNFLDKRGVEEGKFLAWKFRQPSATSSEVKHPEINIDFHNPGYGVSWKYDKETKTYLRYLNGEKHLDGEGQVIKAENLVIQYTDFKVLDSELRLDIKITGEGEAIICQEGRCREGSWQKKDAEARTRYYYPGDREVKFLPGTTWIEVIRNRYKDEIIF